jgi:hypothetical protein
MATLQKQGVPIPSKLSGPQPSTVGAPNGPHTRSATSYRASRGSAPQRAPRAATKSVSARKLRTANGPQSVSASSVPNPVSAGNDATSGVGLLEAEFLAAITILILLLFSDTTSSMTDKMMSAMKRGALICAVFFILALVAGIGPRASKSAKAFGALVIVATLVTSPMSTVLSDLDGLIKNEWIGAAPSTTSGTGTSGTAPSSGKSLGSDAESVVEKAAAAVENDLSPYGEMKKVLGAIGINLP